MSRDLLADRRPGSGSPLATLKKRPDFLKLRHAPSKGTAAFLLAGAPRHDKDVQIRIGYTVTKKMGAAVVRNRIRRRLKEAAKRVFPHQARPGYDYVLVARSRAQSRNFDDLVDDMKRALLSLHAPAVRD